MINDDDDDVYDSCEDCVTASLIWLIDND